MNATGKPRARLRALVVAADALRGIGDYDLRQTVAQTVEQVLSERVAALGPEPASLMLYGFTASGSATARAHVVAEVAVRSDTSRHRRLIDAAVQAAAAVLLEPAAERAG